MHFVEFRVGRPFSVPALLVKFFLVESFTKKKIRKTFNWRLQIFKKLELATPKFLRFVEFSDKQPFLRLGTPSKVLCEIWEIIFL